MEIYLDKIGKEVKKILQNGSTSKVNLDWFYKNNNKRSQVEVDEEGVEKKHDHVVENDSNKTRINGVTVWGQRKKATNELQREQNGKRKPNQIKVWCCFHVKMPKMCLTILTQHVCMCVWAGRGVIVGCVWWVYVGVCWCEKKRNPNYYEWLLHAFGVYSRSMLLWTELNINFVVDFLISVFFTLAPFIAMCFNNFVQKKNWEHLIERVMKPNYYYWKHMSFGADSVVRGFNASTYLLFTKIDC